MPEFQADRAAMTGSEEVAGLECERWELTSEGWRTVVWAWNGVPLSFETASGENWLAEVAARVRVNAPIDGAVFETPVGINVIDRSGAGTDILMALEGLVDPRSYPSAFRREDFPASEPSSPFPSAEPFEASRMWSVFAGEDGALPQIEELVSALGGVAGVSADTAAAMEDIFPREGPSKPSALLESDLSADEKVWLQVLPMVVAGLGALYSAEELSAEEKAFALQAELFLAVRPYGPRLELADVTPERRRQELDLLGRWLFAQASRPDRYAGMIFTMDYGPYQGLPYEGPLPKTPSSIVGLDETRELRLYEIGGPDPFVMACFQGDDPLWARHISDAPDRTVSHVEFAESPPDRLGAYGWKVHMYVTWANGFEYSHLYLDTDARFLFYFMSW